MGLYDPITNTYADGPTHGKGNGAFNGGVLRSNEKVLLVPFHSANIGIVELYCQMEGF